MTQDTPDTLKALRARIDAVDDQLIALLKERIGIIHEVASYKRAHTPADCHIRPGREGEMHRRIQRAFTGSDFPPSAALLIWRQIIGASTHLESPITIAIGPGQDGLAWHAREYFGRPVRHFTAESIADAINAVQTKRATIALLPAPTDTNLPEWSLLAQHPQLQVFASLPVVLAPGEMPSCYAVAAVATEASGDDISLVLFPTGAAPAQAHILAHNDTYALVALDGATESPSLGHLPKPITDISLTPW